MTPQELKNSILQLAIQGRLVEQRPEEGTAEELYKAIIADKKVTLHGKKESKLSSETIPENEIPFDIPETWKWVRFGHIVINRDAERIPLSVDERKNLKKVYDYYGASGVIDKVDKYLFDKKLLLIGEDGANLLMRSTPIAFLAKGEYWVNNHAHVLDCNESLLCMEYLMYYVNAISLAKYVTGTAQPKMNQEKMNSIPVSLPPLAEQKRIVAKIEELLPYIDRYEKAWSRLEDFNKCFPTDMQKSILQLAIQGKLVPQRPEEGTGEALYQQIQNEKQSLIRSGQLKKEKPLPEITPDEIPFDIPESWRWVRWGDLSKSIQYGYNAPALPAGRIKMVRISDIQDGQVLWDSVPYCEIDEETIADYRLKENDILFARTGGTVGKSYLVKTIREEAVYAGYLIRTQYSELLCPEYMKFFMESQLYWDQLHNGTIATAQPNCNGKTLAKMILPLPPLAEQKRIVAKLEELLPLCERLS